MDFRAFLVLLLLNVLRASISVEVEYDPDPYVHWENFKKTFQKSYTTEEEPMKRANFEENFKHITEHNLKYDQGLHTFYLGLNEFDDMSDEEFQKMSTGLQVEETSYENPFEVSSSIKVPDSVDWRKAGAVSRVRNQSPCGSCYAFSAVGALEGQNKLRHGKLVTLSEQNIVDCSDVTGNSACEGGTVQAAFKYVMINKGLDSLKSYPYTGENGTCKYREKYSASNCTYYLDIIPRTEERLKTAVGVVGPISIAVDSHHRKFKQYRGGIYNNPRCTEQLTHAMLAVGYGSERGLDYWIVKNSWGPGWGEKGYVRMIRNSNNQCGIANQATFPIV